MARRPRTTRLVIDCPLLGEHASTPEPRFTIPGKRGRPPKTEVLNRVVRAIIEELGDGDIDIMFDKPYRQQSAKKFGTSLRTLDRAVSVAKAELRQK